MRPGFWLISTLFLPVVALTQPAPKPLQVGVGLMGVSYTGDLTDEDTYLRRVQPGGNVSIQFDGQSFLQPQFHVGFGKFTEQSDRSMLASAPDAIPNTFVETSFFYADLRMRGRFLRRRAIQPVLGLGAGMFFFNPLDKEGNYLGENTYTRLPEEQYNTTVSSFSGTAGLIGRINPVVSLSWEYTFRWVGSDYLDNIGLLGSQSGNDRLQHMQVGLLFSLRPRKGGEKEAPGVPEQAPPLLSEVAVPDSTAPAAPEKEVKAWNTTAPTGVDQPLIAPIKAQSVGKDWLAIEQAALLQRKFVYYPMRAGDDLDFLVAYFHVRRQTIRRLNFLINEEIEPGTILRLPDMGLPFP